MSYVVHLDIESFSKINLKKVGVYRYAEDISTEILCIAWAFATGAVSLWIPYALPKDLKKQIYRYVHTQGGMLYVGPKVPQPLQWHADRGGQFRAHNSQFERVMLKGNPGKKIKFPITKRSQWYCVAAKAAVLAMPRDLLRLCSKTALDTPHKKDEDGKGAMMQVTQPRKPSKHNPDTRWTPFNSPERFYKLYTYNVDDVLSERDCDHAMVDLSKKEREIFLLDQVINDRGWMVDLDRVADVRYLIAEYKARIVRKMKELVRFKVVVKGKTTEIGLKPSQTEKFAKWVRDKGVVIENLQAQTVVDTLKRRDLPQNVRWALRMYSLHNMKAPAKYDAMVRAVCKDGALHGMFLYFGASTSRWTSRIVQIQNLFRPIIDDPENAIEAFRMRSISWLKALYTENPMKIFASCVRGMLIPRKGRDLLFADYASIEARIVAWLADQRDMLKIFATHGLAYEYVAAKMFNLPNDLDSLKRQKKEHPIKRFLGKIGSLSLSYQGGGAAFVKMAKQYGTDVIFEQGESFKWDWRNQNPKVVQLWDNLQNAAIAAIENPGTTVKTNKVMFRVVGDYLKIRIPSGSKLSYYKPFIRNGEICFWGINTHTRQWAVCSTFGGKILQNICEMIARDLMTCAMIKLYKKGYKLLGTVHDEIITEPKEGWGSVKEVIAIMCDSPEWASGLPVRAEGERCKRYRK